MSTGRAATATASRRPTGRPLAGEYAEYAGADIAHVPGDDAVEALRAVSAETLALLTPIGEGAATGLTYAPGEWTLKEIVGHLSDDERIFTYRASKPGSSRESPRAMHAAWRSISRGTSCTIFASCGTST